MKTMKMALMAGAAVAVSAAAAHADELSDLKAQVEALNTRMAAMETAPSVPTGYQLLAISKGEALQVPGMLGSDRDRVVNNNATIISVMPTADAPAGTTISWSGYVRAAVVYAGHQGNATLKLTYTDPDGKTSPQEFTLNKGKENEVTYTDGKIKYSNLSDDDWDVRARGQLKVVATTDTAVGEVGVELKMRADFNGNGSGDAYMKTAWGYWAMTPELTFGGGYTGSLGNIGYGYDGACTCYYTDNADLGFDPGDTTQLRLSYASGPFSMAVALEDSGLNNGFGNDNSYYNGNNLGVAGELKYSGDAFSGEISGVYRTVNADDYTAFNPILSAVTQGNVDSLWQIGAGVGFNLGDIASISLAAALGSGPYTDVNNNGTITAAFPVQNNWWGVTGLASANLSDSVHAEVGAGYKNRQTDGHTYDATDIGADTLKTSGTDYSTWGVLGGVYYTPVDQLTIGLEGEWYTTQTSNSWKISGGQLDTYKLNFDTSTDNWTVDLVSVWRF
ncbi:hypothetical protein [Aestuariivirga sp.]|uniref:hypothetical protein n=1 Tax=Aestuariivirga sp. TaxID=2650926 RepID=UPI00301A7DDE